MVWFLRVDGAHDRFRMEDTENASVGCWRGDSVAQGRGDDGEETGVESLLYIGQTRNG